MSISLLVAGVGGIAAAVATGLLIAKCRTAARGAMVGWTVAMFGLTISLLAQASGHAFGFGPVAFRLMELGAGVIAPLALIVGLSRIAGKTAPVRFAALLVLPALGFVALVILISDPLTAHAFGKGWPDPALHYQIIPENLLAYTAPLTVLLALIGIIVVVLRPQRDPAWQQAIPPAAAAAAAAIVISLPGLVVLASVRHHPVSLPTGGLFPWLCIIAGVLVWFGCRWTAQLPVSELRFGPGDRADHRGPDRGEWDDTGWHGRAEPAGAADADADPYGGLYRQRDEHRDFPADSYPADSYAGSGYDSGYLPEDSYAGFAAGAPGSEAGARPPGWDEDAGGSRADFAGPAGSSAIPSVDNGSSGADLFGQIAIYTLLEDQAAEFDKLTKRVVKQVRANEPDTLVFIVHQVPSAPMQRILYEVYRDRDGYDRHQSQPYVAQFEHDSQPYVLATNVIELGLQQAKVSPLPSISRLLTDTGFDLLEDTGFGQPGYAPRGPGAAAQAAPQAADPLGSDPLGPDPLGPDPLGSDPLGADPRAADPRGASRNRAGQRAADPLVDPLGPDPYRDRAGYSDPARRSRPDYSRPAGREDWSEYETPDEDGAGYRDRAGYPDRPGYPDDAPYPGEHGYPGRSRRRSAGHDDEPERRPGSSAAGLPPEIQPR